MKLWKKALSLLLCLVLVLSVLPMAAMASDLPDDPGANVTPDGPGNPDDPNNPGNPDDPGNPDEPMPVVIIDHSVTFNPGNGDASWSVSVVDGATVSQPSVTHPGGFELEGWYTDAGFNSAFSFSTPITQDTTLYAKWKDAQSPSMYVVTFIPDNGSANIVFSTSDVVDPMPANPTRTGYSFGGWYIVSQPESEITEASAAVNAGTVYTQATYVKAKWTPYSYTVKFDANGGDGTMEDQSFTYDAEQSLTPNAFTSESGSFAGWNTEVDGSGTAYTDGQSVKNLTAENGGAVTLYAQWETSHTVTFHFNYDSKTEDKTVAHKAKVTEPEEPQRTGYGFDGWYADEDFKNEYNFESPVVTGIDLYAKWTANTFTVKFDANGGTGSMADQSFTYDTEQPLTKNAFERDGYIFLRWNRASDGSDREYEDGATVKNMTGEQNGSVTLYAQWEREYTITYELDGGSLPEGVTNPGTYTAKSEDITLTNPEKEGYTFAGWTGSNGTTPETAVTIAKGSTGDKTYTAVWTANSYKISFNANGGTGTMADLDCEYGKSYALTANAFTNGEKIFAGWNTAADGSGKDYADGATVENLTAKDGETVTLYAQWAQEFTITYNLDGGSLSKGVTNPATYTDKSDNFTLKNPTKKGYAFLGWTGSNGTEPQKEVTVLKGSTGDLTFTANWIKAYKVTYLPGDGTGSMAPSTDIYGEYTLRTCGFTAPEGKVFSGWQYGNSVVRAGTVITVTGNVTVTAVWMDAPAPLDPVSKTGDTTGLMFWLTLAAFSAMALAGYELLNKKRVR